VLENAPSESIVLADVNADGWLDLVVSSPGAGTRVHVLDRHNHPEFTGENAFSTMGTLSGRFHGHDALIADVDSDGNPDFMLGDDRRGIVLLRGH
jgi:FG-GAP-like repeat